MKGLYCIEFLPIVLTVLLSSYLIRSSLAFSVRSITTSSTNGYFNHGNSHLHHLIPSAQYVSFLSSSSISLSYMLLPSQLVLQSKSRPRSCSLPMMITRSQRQGFQLTASAFEDFEEFSDEFQQQRDNQQQEEQEKQEKRQQSSKAPSSSSLSPPSTSLPPLSPSSSPLSSSSSSLHNSLQARLQTILGTSSTVLSNWRSGKCCSTIRLALQQDWIRRVAIVYSGNTEGGGSTGTFNSPPSSSSLFPLTVVCGGASGSLYLADLESGTVLDESPSLHVRDLLDAPGDGNVLREAMTKMYGAYDGGGVITIAAGGVGVDGEDLVVSSGREGGVRVHAVVEVEDGKSGYVSPTGVTGELNTNDVEDEDGYNRDNSLDQENEEEKTSRNEIGVNMMLNDCGIVPGLDTLVTGLSFNAEKGEVLWVSTYDGRIIAYECDQWGVRRGRFRRSKRGKKTAGSVEERGLSSSSAMIVPAERIPLHEIDVGCSILSLSVNDEAGCGTVAVSDGRVVLFSLKEGKVLSEWRPFGNDDSYEDTEESYEEYARSTLIVKEEDENRLSSFSVVCGGSAGNLYYRKLSLNIKKQVISFEAENSGITRRLTPPHDGPVVELTSPAPGLFLSGSQDGSIRVWDCSNRTSIRDDENSASEEDSFNDEGIKNIELLPRCMYGLSGYKVWLGSICTDGTKIVSDGADNSIVVHDFSSQSEKEIN